ncbi:type III PLP-dependent enzyme [Antarctobacter heliothermus]|uniref:ornithine decarboxylase n=1 Tax=Antarctobacter heliothermus TaxID=74033 RepID=A0A239B4W0_9RHOB|nr:type III PLP-dependent enzyme [Antarctobacter heliothermus]SNS02976.1 ornithine decarboxylase [Antarctobacter heliothermus]
MVLQQAFQRDPALWLARMCPDEPVLFFDPARLRATAALFMAHFPGEVTYAVKANPDSAVLDGLVAAGMAAFDVASPEEMALVRKAAPQARLHYHNPIRSQAEIAAARRYGITSWSVDRMSELDKLGPLEGAEIAVRLKLPVAGAAYDFGSKFGAGPEPTGALLRAVVARGGVPSLTFHPGTQCREAQAWQSYIRAAVQIVSDAGIRLHRLNVGGGFPAHREDPAPDLPALFAAIDGAVAAGFGAERPALVCEPGRAMVAEAFDLALRIKARDGVTVFLNDGVYGALGEWRDMGPSTRLTVLGADGHPRIGGNRPMTVFGPTCDSLDRLPDRLPLPEALEEGDYLLVHGCGAYSAALATQFNGYGARRIVTLAR